MQASWVYLIYFFLEVSPQKISQWRKLWRSSWPLNNNFVSNQVKIFFDSQISLNRGPNVHLLRILSICLTHPHEDDQLTNIHCFVRLPLHQCEVIYLFSVSTFIIFLQKFRTGMVYVSSCTKISL